MRTLWRDARFGARALLKSPWLTLAAVVSLGVGIGANTTIFSLENAALLRPLPGVREALPTHEHFVPLIVSAGA